MTEWVAIRHPELDLTAKVTHRAWKYVHSRPENGGWHLIVTIDEEEE